MVQQWCFRGIILDYDACTLNVPCGIKDPVELRQNMPELAYECYWPNEFDAINYVAWQKGLPRDLSTDYGCQPLYKISDMAGDTEMIAEQIPRLRYLKQLLSLYPERAIPGYDYSALNEVCFEGETRCTGYDLQQCVDNTWTVIEPNSTSCGYVPPCECTVWQDAECISETKRKQTRSCTPAGCDIETRNVADASCATPCECTDWVPAECVSETQRRLVRDCTPDKCAAESAVVNDPTCGTIPPEPSLVPIIVLLAAAAGVGIYLFARK